MRSVITIDVDKKHSNGVTIYKIETPDETYKAFIQDFSQILSRYLGAKLDFGSDVTANAKKRARECVKNSLVNPIANYPTNR